MSTQKFKSYSVYLLFRFCFSLLFSMATVLSVVYHLEVVKLNAFQLVMVGTVLETACFLFEIPTGVVADLYSRRRSVLIGMFLYGIGFLMEGALPWFGTVLLAQVVWGCGDTFITGALEAWIASEEAGKSMDKVFMRGSQLGQLGGIAGVVMGTLRATLTYSCQSSWRAYCACCSGCCCSASCRKRTFHPHWKGGRACSRTSQTCSN